MKYNFSLLFYIRKQKDYHGGVTPIYLRITVDGKRAEFVTGNMCDPSKWNNKANRMIGTKAETKSINAFLDNLQAKVYEAYRELCDDGKPVTAEAIKDKLLGKEEKEYMLLEIFEDHNDKMAALVGKEYAPGTLQRYETSLKHTRDFIQYKYKLPDINIKRIDHAFITEYDYYLRTVRNCANNSAVKYIKNFKKIIRICLANGWIIADPFVKYKGHVRPVERVFLSEEELQKLTEKEFASERLTQVRDVFLFCCFTGLAYSDVKQLRNSYIRKGVDGEQWIFTKRQKTDTRVAIPLLPAAVKLLKKYSHHPRCLNKDIPLPVPSNQKLNGYLKEIATLCGINKDLTSHIARHTFATTVTLSNGIPIESVSKMLGHSSLKQTQHYAKILDVKVGEDMKILKGKYQ